MLLRRTERLERAFWRWRLRLTRVGALLPSSVLTALAAAGVLLTDLLTTGPSRPRAHRRARASA